MRGITAAAACAVGAACAALPRFLNPAPPGEPVAHLDITPAVSHADVRAAAKGVIAREVAEGRMGLPEAAAAFGWLNAREPATVSPSTRWQAACVGLPDGDHYTEGEALALQVVHRVSLRGFDAVAAVAQFRSARAEGRLERLPDVPVRERERLLARAEAEVAAWPGGRLTRAVSAR